jgi:hypothetical protein
MNSKFLHSIHYCTSYISNKSECNANSEHFTLIHLTQRHVLISIIHSLKQHRSLNSNVSTKDRSNHSSASTDFAIHRDDQLENCNRNGRLSRWDTEEEWFVRNIENKNLFLTVNSTSYYSSLPSYRVPAEIHLKAFDLLDVNNSTYLGLTYKKL